MIASLYVKVVSVPPIAVRMVFVALATSRQMEIVPNQVRFQIADRTGGLGSDGHVPDELRPDGLAPDSDESYCPNE